jgi:UDP-N-acetyl-L-fucosamine synthase
LKRLKVVTVVGTRPEIIRLSRLIPKLDEHTEHILVHTGQNYDRQLNEVFFEELELRQPDYYLEVDTSSLGAVMGDTLRKAEEVFLKERPDAVMILGDTNSAIAAVVAERMHIPVYHMEAGNRSFDNNVPEELNRRMVDHVSTFNLPYTEQARRNLLAEGIHSRFIYKTGSPLAEIFSHQRHRVNESQILQKLKLGPGEYFLASVHRQETVDDLEKLIGAMSSLESVSRRWSMPVIVSTHPRTRKRLEELNSPEWEGVVFHEPFGYLDYNKLQINAKCVISDSGSIAEESATMNFPAVSLRDSIERPEAIEKGTLLLSGVSPSDVERAVEFSLATYSATSSPDDYMDESFSKRVLAILLSTANRYEKWTNVSRNPSR